MSYTINGVEKDVDDYGYLLEPDFSEEAVQVISAACGITMTNQHWKVVNFLRNKFKEDGHTPNMRNLIKGLLKKKTQANTDGIVSAIKMRAESV